MWNGQKLPKSKFQSNFYIKLNLTLCFVKVTGACGVAVYYCHSYLILANGAVFELSKEN